MKPRSDINWKVILFTVVNSIVLALIFDASPDLKLSWRLHSELDVTYQDLAATLLSAVSVLVTILGVIIAIITFVGYRQIKFAATRKAEEHVKDSIQNSAGELHKLVKKEVHELVRKEVQDITYQHLRDAEIPPEVIDSNSEYGD